MTAKLLTEYNLELLSLTGGFTGLSESTLVKMPHCWKSRVTAHFINYRPTREGNIAVSQVSVCPSVEESLGTSLISYPVSISFRSNYVLHARKVALPFFLFELQENLS